MSERDKLMGQLYRTEDPAKKMAIVKRLKALDKQQADKALEQALTVVDAPLREMKEGLSGDPGRWFPKGSDTNVGGGTFAETSRAAGVPDLSPQARADASGMFGMGADVLLDPLNAVGGAVAGVGKAGARIPGAIASMSNYIPDWYSPNALDKAKGFAGWLGDTAGSMASHLTDPRSRALYAEQKITKPAQNRIANLDPKDPRAREKATSQIQYTSGHIPQQTGATASTNPAADEIMKRSFVEPYAPLEGDNLSEAIQRNGVTSKNTGEEVLTSKADADYVQDYVKRTQKNPEQFVIKAPVAKETGGHHHDVIYSSPAKAALKDLFIKNADADGNVSPEVMASWLRENTQKYNAKLPHKSSWKVQEVTDDGVWLRGGKVGSAITEGGVSWLMKVSPDGELAGYMIDSHDFAEKLLPGAVKETVVAVTPTMRNNIKNIGGGKNKQLEIPLRDEAGKVVKDGRKTVKKAHKAPDTYVQTGHRGTGGKYSGIFDEYNKAVPSSLGVARETAALMGEGLLAQRAIDNSQETGP